MNFIVKLPALFKKQARITTHEFVNPTRDWTIALFCAILVGIAGIGYISLDFYLQFGVVPQAISADVQTQAYRAKEVTYYAEQYAERERQFNALRSNTVYVPPEPVSQSATSTVEGDLPEEGVTTPLAEE